MNEIVGTLYFVLAQDANDEWAKEAEADTYFLFNSILVEMRDVFVPDLDCLLYTSPSPRDRTRSRMPSSA